MARHSEDLYGKYGVYGFGAYDFKPVGNEGPGEYCKKESSTLSRKKPKELRSPALAVGCILCAVLIFAGLISRSYLTVLSQETVALQKDIEELLDEQTRLKIRHEMAFSLAETEEYAIEVLGMQKPTAEQITYIDILPDERDEDKAADIPERDILSLIREYFPG